MRGVMLAAALLLTAARAQPPVGFSCAVTRVDRVERQFYCAGQRRPVVGVFSSRYRLAGTSVPARAFWNALAPGDVLAVKANQGALFAVAVIAARR